MRVLLVSALPPPLGGIATWTLKYVDYCKRDNIFVDVVNISLTGKRAIDVTSLKVNLIEEIIRSHNISSDFKSKIKKSPDIVHINTSLSKFGLFRDYLLILKSKKKKKPIVLHCHCNIPDRLKGRLSKAIFGKMIEFSSRVFVMNKASADYIKKTTKIEAELIPNFIEEKQILPIHCIRERIENVVYVGHVQDTKGCNEIIDAARDKPEIMFNLVGPIDPDFKLTNIPQNVIMHGNVMHDQIKQHLVDADVFLLPSYSEGFSMSLLEAMACGLPVITTNVGANEEMTEGKGSVLIPVKSSNAIAEALEKIQDYNLRREMSNWNIMKVKKQYSEVVVMKTIIDAYKNVGEINND